jgi:hypothetical protein
MHYLLLFEEKEKKNKKEKWPGFFFFPQGRYSLVAVPCQDFPSF